MTFTVRTASSSADDPQVVAAELRAGAWQDDAVIAIMFASSCYPAGELVQAVGKAFDPVMVVGCTTAGEIGAGGFGDRSVVLMTMAGGGLRVAVGLSTSLRQSPLAAGREAALSALATLGVTPENVRRNRHVAVSLIDGRSGREESFIAGAASAIPSVGIVGGSASDDVEAAPCARIFAHGNAFSGAGLLLLFETDTPFTIVLSEHMRPSPRRVVVTEADPETRTVMELNGRPAMEVYQELIGGPVDSDIAAQHPFAQYLGGRAYVRSVMEVVGSALRFACAVENGVVLRVAEPGDLLATTARSLEEASAAVGGIGGLLAFNCVGRYLEAVAGDKVGELAALLTRYPVIGFNTFGEQAGALHINHTLTALAFGRQPR